MTGSWFSERWLVEKKRRKKIIGVKKFKAKHGMEVGQCWIFKEITKNKKADGELVQWAVVVALRCFSDGTFPSVTVVALFNLGKVFFCLGTQPSQFIEVLNTRVFRPYQHVMYENKIDYATRRNIYVSEVPCSL